MTRPDKYKPASAAFWPICGGFALGLIVASLALSAPVTPVPYTGPGWEMCKGGC